MKNLQDYRIFLETARLGSISACARQMDITPATASAAIKRLEAELEVVLFIRSTRSLRLSEKGENFLPLCREALALFDEAISSIRSQDAELSGQIRLSSPSDLGRNVVLPILDEFMDAHPKVDIRLHLSDSYADLYGEQIDLALRYGQPEDSSLIAMPISPHNTVLLCASPSYIKQHGIPKKPADLRQHNCLCLARQDVYHTRWQFVREINGKRTTHSIEVTGNRMSKDGDAVRLWALAGKGIARKSYLDIASNIKRGELKIINFTGQGWQDEYCPLYLFCVEKRLMSPTVKALRDFLVEKIALLNRTI